MPYIGAGIQRFNTADSLTVNGDAEVTGTVNPSGDTASGDTAAVGFTSTEGLILTGQGSTNDITIKNDADADVLEIPTGTTNVTIAGNLGVGGTVTGTGTSVFASLDISGDIDVDGTTNLDAVDIDGAVDMASTLQVDGAITSSAGATLSSSSSGEFNALTISQADNTSGNESRIRFKRTTDAGSDREVAAIVADRLGGNDTDLVFETNTDGSDGAVEKMRLSHLGILSIDQLFGLSDTDTGIALGANGANIMQFYTGNSERMRISSAGNLSVGKTDSGDIATVGAELSASGFGMFSRTSAVPIFTNRSDSGDIVQFYRANTKEGSISITSTGVTFNTTSDIRLKQDIEPLQATDKLMAMNPVSFTWKAEPDGQRSMGFIAQEMQEIMPEAVSADDSEEKILSMDYGRITPILVSALQDAHKKIEELENRIAAMESK